MLAGRANAENEQSSPERRRGVARDGDAAPARQPLRYDGGPDSGSHDVAGGLLSMRTLITNGTIVTADGSHDADILIDGETIAAIGTGLEAAGLAADETIDAKGRYVIPGGI